MGSCDDLTVSVNGSSEVTRAAGSTADRALSELKQAIVRGALLPGSVVSENELAGKLGMSRTPVRQALDRLRADGWVTIAPRSGVTIAPIDPDSIQDIYEALSALEGAACLRFDAANAPAMTQLEAATAACEVALENNDLVGWADADDRLHGILLAECGNSQLLRLARPLMDHAHRVRLHTVKLRPFPTSSNEDHRRILERIAAGDREGARDELLQHRRRGMDVVLPILRQLTPLATPFLS